MAQSNFDWNDVKLFLQIARTGRLTAAAATLDLSQPTASRRLRALEILIGKPLFQTSSSGYALTDAGEVMLGHAERIEEEALTLSRRLTGGDLGIAGVVRVTSCDWFSHRVLASPVARFVLANPSVTVEVIADPRSFDLRRREADLAIRFNPFGDASVIQRRLAEVRFGLYAAEAYLNRCGFPDPTELGVGHHFVLLDSALDDAADVKWARGCWPKARAALRSNSRETLGEACVQGAGLAVLPRVLGDDLPLKLLDTFSPPGQSVYLGYHSDLKPQLRLRTFIDFIADAIGKQV